MRKHLLYTGRMLTKALLAHRHQLLIGWLTLTALLLYSNVQLAHFGHFLDRHAAIVAGRELSPYQYRVLVPVALDAVTQSPVGLYIGYWLLHAIGFCIFYAGLYRWLRRFGSDTLALSSLLAVGLLMPVVLQQYAFSPWAIAEIALVVCSLNLAREDERRPLYALLVLAASLNKETGFVLALIYACSRMDELRGRDGRTWRWTLLNVGITVTVFLSLRLLRGDTPHVYGIVGTLEKNLSILDTATLHNLLIAPLWLGAVLGWRAAPARLRWLLLGFVAPYMASVLILARWDEIRLQLTVAPVLLALCVVFVAQESMLARRIAA